MNSSADSAPLIATPGAPVPKGGTAEWLTAKDGVRLRAALFPAVGSTRGSVVLSPGRSEPIEKYFEVVGELQGRGFAVLVHDWRGQGLSARATPDRLAGHARGWRPFLTDFDLLLTAFAPRLPKPWLLVGHSMGGGLAALALAQGEARFEGAVLSAPMLGLNTAPRAAAGVRAMATLMSFIGRAGALTSPAVDPMTETFEQNRVTHDRARWDRFRDQLIACPDLMLGGVTWGWLQFAFLLIQRVQHSRNVEALEIPVTVVAAEEEKLCVNAAAGAFAERLAKGRYVEVPGAYHEILMETDPRRAVFWREFDEIADKVAPPVKGAVEPAPKPTKPKAVKSKPAAAGKAAPPVKTAARSAKAKGAASPKAPPKPPRAPAKPGSP